jgi:hypothetical protein
VNIFYVLYGLTSLLLSRVRNTVLSEGECISLKPQGRNNNKMKYDVCKEGGCWNIGLLTIRH